MMRNLLAFVAGLVLLFSTLGWWRGWYRVESQPAEQGQSAFRVELNYSKVGQDFVEAGKSVYRTLSRSQDETTGEAGK
jgi:hypothetical protein